MLRASSFQSIGVTKDWRPKGYVYTSKSTGRFQSIGVTKDWRLNGKLLQFQKFTKDARFQSIGVTKDWRPTSRATS